MWKECVLLLVITHISTGIDPHSSQYFSSIREKVKEIFYHAYNGYLDNAYPYDELRPLTCDGVNTWGSFSLTLVDALDTLAILGNYTEFRRVANLLVDTLDFNQNINASVFETNIRVVGGLLSAHLLAPKAGMEVDPEWPCKGPLLTLAVDLAKKILPAFDTQTGMPYGTINLKYGVDPKETPETCTAGVGTFLVEFAALSRLTGDQSFENIALRAVHALNASKSALGMIGNHINVVTGKWTALDAGVGAGVDSYYEYLVKGAIMLNKPELMDIFKEFLKPIEQHIKQGDWYMWVNMNTGHTTMPVHQSLDAFWPGLQTLYGDVEKGYKTLLNYYSVWYRYGGTPEFFSIPHNAPIQKREGYPLRPELIESTLYMYRATKDPALLEFGEALLYSINATARTECGFATVKDVRDHTLDNRMESFFLAETIKYIYLLFDPENELLQTGKGASIRKMPNGRKCLFGAGGYIFNTEAHPIDVSALHCCDTMRREQERSKTLQLFEEFDPKRVFEMNRQARDSNRKPQTYHEAEDPTLLNNATDQNVRLGCEPLPYHMKMSRYGQLFVND
uniref:alpha-1,2-Mannosidase n=1 Tax=Phallusia mammillata TaxID=59560 RepID=A0A6F9DC60_9ASCI|nr:ER degradation-enhancing alpha-mannosidase-like protein 2 [Phallusia mammillata]